MKPYYEADGVRLYHGDCTRVLSHLDAGTVQTCITSPPYFGLRDYGVAGQLGLEGTPEEYVANMVDVFRELRRVLRDDGTLWLNLGDSYAFSGKGGNPGDSPHVKQRTNAGSLSVRGVVRGGVALKPKDLVGIPWRVAFALQADGWYLRSDIIWHKPNPMPESVTDRPTKAHEYLFLLTKSERYYYDAAAVAEPAMYAAPDGSECDSRKLYEAGSGRADAGRKANHAGFYRSGRAWNEGHRNRRTVWTVASQPYAGAHFATFPPKLIRPCVLAGSRHGDLVLDPFNGAGTTGVVALGEGRRYVGVDINVRYLDLSRERIEAATEQRTLNLGGAA